MKLLLTSGGITTQKIADELNKLVGQGGKKVAFVPTAANAEPNGPWFLEQVDNLRKFGFDQIDFVDPSAAENDWRSRLNKSDIIFVSGGNTFHLLKQTRDSGFGEWLKQNIDRKIYVGSSAGSILATPSIAAASVDHGDRNIPGLKDLTGLNLVDFELSPHTPTEVSDKGNREYAATIANKLYGINDQSAILVSGNKIKVVHDGDFWEY
ncbi:MAG TPA: Type 1 glutamine amidotransferase-like domain-containing protein [Candidatus Saccharimonadales bacterium]|nr:Type 1 glutamine amidotransferase-like domain-containing protein [Candidatus Saccharimonadales bacterium]